MSLTGAIANVVMTLGIVIGAIVGGYLGLLTERGVPGLIAAVGLVGGGAVGLYIAQALLAGGEEPR